MSVTALPTSIFGPERDQLFRELMQIDRKAEIVDGRIIIMSPTGAWPCLVALRIANSLLEYEEQNGVGYAVGDNAIFRVTLPHRDTFSPDAAYFTGPPPDMSPFEGAPVFAAEVRSIGDYGPRGDRLAAEKRADYFAAGTLVVWDVDLLSNDVVNVYRASAPDTPTIYRPGDTAEAEPAVPGWTVAVDELLPDGWQPTRPKMPN